MQLKNFTTNEGNFSSLIKLKTKYLLKLCKNFVFERKSKHSQEYKAYNIFDSVTLFQPKAGMPHWEILIRHL